MPFDEKNARELLIKCHRRCCVCHRFCGVKLELDHIVPSAEGGSDEIGNAIPLCFECHAEVHAYNDKHPRGRKFKPEELRGHRDQWLMICSTQPQALIAAPLNNDVGPLQALIDEMEFNLAVIPRDEHQEMACPFASEQFRRALATGSISILEDSLKTALLTAYAHMGQAREAVERARYPQHAPEREALRRLANREMIGAHVKIEAARSELLKFVQRR